MKLFRCQVFFLLIILLFSSVPFAQTPIDEPINPYPRPIQKVEFLLKKEFKTPEDLQDWKPLMHISAFEIQKNGSLLVGSNGDDPYFCSPDFSDGLNGNIRVTIRMESKMGPMAQIFWATKARRNWVEEHALRFRVLNDSQFHDYVFDLPLGLDELHNLRIDPGVEPGTVQIVSVTIEREMEYPLEIKKTQLSSNGRENSLELIVKNHSSEKQAIHCEVFDPLDPNSTISKTLISDSETTHTMNWENGAPFVFRVLRLKFERQQEPLCLERVLCAIAPEPNPDGVEISSDSLSLQFDQQYLGAVVRKNGNIIGTIFPLIYHDDTLPTHKDFGASEQKKETPGMPVLKLKSKTANQIDLLAAKTGSLRFHVIGDEIQFEYRGNRPVHGPVFRPIGRLEQGLLSGVEYLDDKDWSSSSADIATEERIRYSPDPLDVTMPLSAIVTDQCSMAMLWKDPKTQVIFATPDFITNTSQHRMNLFGDRFFGIVRVGNGFEQPGGRLEDAILWAVQKRRLPNLPKAPRTSKQQHALNLKGLMESEGYVKEKGWKHASITGHPELFPPTFSADMISTVWQITGKVPAHGELSINGAHLPNPAVYFLENQAEQWLEQTNARAIGLRNQQQPDGSFRYSGKYTKGHYENTASGYCGFLTYQLLLHYRQTGNTESLDAAIKALEYMKRFRTPRGAQTWELSLHTPDIMGSAWCVLAYTYAFEATEKAEYLDLARRWALTGLPFVYQWSEYPIMAYATTPVLGATNWTAPNWIGLPVQWCGLDYGEALFEFAKHDNTLDWHKIAEGILLSAEQQQYTEGESIGLLPDSFTIRDQKRNPADITPVVLEQQRRRLDGLVPAMSLAISENHRVFSPFPVTILGNQATVEAQTGTTYQVIIDGLTVRTIESQGRDVIDL